MPKPHVATFGKLVRRVARLRGGGSAFPGLVIEKISPTFTQEVLATLPHGVVVISGTNGKTTTTKMVVELLESQGLRVFTNRTGSNFARGVTAALLGEVDYKGKLAADIAVLELDEAHAVKFVAMVPPTHCLLLNVMRDQLDRFGEIDTTAQLLTHIAKATTRTVVLNREDPRVAAIANTLSPSVAVQYFGLAPALRAQFPHDDNLRHTTTTAHSTTPALATLDAFSDTQATFTLQGTPYTTSLSLKGVYNTYNAAAALALVAAICGDSLKATPLLRALAQVTPAFGRGETVIVNGQPVDLVLVKNPGGFRLALQSFSPSNVTTMIAINDNYADGRDMSWLWDVDFTSLANDGVAITSGVRAYDMALRLGYDDITARHILPDLKEALTRLLADHADQPKRIYCSYTAMLTLRKLLAEHATMEKVL